MSVLHVGQHSIDSGSASNYLGTGRLNLSHTMTAAIHGLSIYSYLVIK